MELATINDLDEVQRAALAELAARELAERHLHDFVSQAWGVVCPDEEFVDGWHIRAICAHLEAVTDGRISQLLINVPPGTMKSLLVGVFWPAWVWTKRPAKKFMYASYSDYLSLRDSVRCRDLVQSQWYQTRWPLGLKDDSNTKGKWNNMKGGWRLATSVGGKGTGEHPDVKCFDDPHNVQQSESEAERASVTQWWDGTMESRGAMKGSASVGVMQRLHASDLSGHLLEKGGWDHICLPMRYESPSKDEKTGAMVPRMKPTSIGWTDPRTVEGELLWPQGYDEAKVAGLEIKLGLYNAAGQLQQRPTPKGGGTFERGWFKVLPQCPPLIRVVRYWDKAGTKGGTGAESAGVAIGEYEDPHGYSEDMLKRFPGLRFRYVVLDAVTFRERAAQREALIKQTADLDKAQFGDIVTTWVEQEPGSGGKESAENTVINLAGHAVNIERVTGSKEVRAAPLASQASVGRVAVLPGDWTRQFLDEVEQFPLGKLKDLVDGASGAFNKLHQPTGGFANAEGIRVGQQSTDRFVPARLQFEPIQF